MSTPRCPHCKRPLPPAAADARPTWAPFCSERCKLADLQKWLGGVYAIPGRPLDEDEIAAGVARTHDDEPPRRR